MVRQVVSGEAVHQHIEIAAMLVEPRNDPIEFVGAERDLATPLRVRAHRLFVHAANLHMEEPPGLVAQRACPGHRVQAEIDVGMIGLVDVLRATGMANTYRFAVQRPGDTVPLAS